MFNRKLNLIEYAEPTNCPLRIVYKQQYGFRARVMLKVTYSMLLFVLFRCTPEINTDLQKNTSFSILSGELTASSIILQCRFANSDTLINYDVEGLEGSGCFQVSEDSSFFVTRQTEWIKAYPEGDFIIKRYISDLVPNTRYYYRVKALIINNYDTVYSSVGRFNTLPDPESPRTISFAISTGFNYEKFYGIDNRVNEYSEYPPASVTDKELGFEAFASVTDLNPDFFIANGDVVYYDNPQLMARSLPEMRAKWHRYLSMPRNKDLCLHMPVFYLKDDHDYRFNDCDTTDVKFAEPSHQLGIQVFKEQLPVTGPDNRSAKTYRTVKAGSLLQLWFLEGRDYRSPNLQEDTPQKTIWGKEQKAWLKQTLLESGSTFKILISPTPLIGPDDAYKKDNHTNVGGFQSEQNEFFNWLVTNDFLNKNFFIICGDRHWQYHSIHPNGLEEFSSGAFVNQNSRPGRKPGDPESTDPEAKISTPFIQLDQWGGGFLYVKTFMDEDHPSIRFSFRDVNGQERYSIKKASKL